MSTSNMLPVMSRLVDMMSSHVYLNSSVAENKNSRWIDDVLEERVDPYVERLNQIIHPSRAKFTLHTGDDVEWGMYIAEAMQAVHNSGDRSLRYMKSPQTFEIGVIDQFYKRLDANPSKDPTPTTATFQIVQGVDAIRLPQSRLAQNAVMQVASQFNFLESKTDTYSDIGTYITDHTQGPRASLGSLAALLLRDRTFRLFDPNATFFRGVFGYRAGYLKPYILTTSQQRIAYNKIQNNINQLRILPQWGIPDTNSGNKILQIFTAAASYQDNPAPQERSYGENICKILIKKQYTAVAQIAAMRSARTGKRVSLHLTLVGQGAFNNPPSVMKAAFESVYTTVKAYHIDVYFHGFNDKDVLTIERSKPEAMELNPHIMSAAEFFV